MSNEQIVKISSPDPSALGLLGLGIITLVASSAKLGITTGVSYVIPWAVFLGALAQFTAAIFDYKKGNVFGATAFAGYGLFWFSMAMSWLISLGTFGEAAAKQIDPKQMGFAFLGYLIFTLFMTIGAMETNKVLFIIFCLIDFLFLGLTLTTFQIATEATHALAAWSELLIAIFSFYAAGANVLNNHFGKTFLPIGKPFGIFK